ncbi:MAG: glycerol kinase GlpK [Clostridia bacterium]
MRRDYVMSLDQGTTSSRAIIFDRDARPVAFAAKEFPQIYPRPGWVEHDPMDIWRTQIEVAREAITRAGLDVEDIAAIGIANQRETTILWDRATGEPVHNAIVWQCRRSAPICDGLKASGWAAQVAEKTGLVIDAYFSATKVKWLLDNVPGLRERARRGEILFGTVDTWLIWNLTGGRVHATDYSNASRTMMFNIHTLDWDDEILSHLGIPRAMLPDVRPSSCVYGETAPGVLRDGPAATAARAACVPIAGDAGDQQAALFGQACFEPGMVKNTYGTGCFMLMNAGDRPVRSKSGLLTTIAWGACGKVEYALEGSVFIAGAAVQWLRDELKLIASAAESEERAAAVPDSGGVYVVPAFVGLGAPHWDMYARGTIVGITRGTSKDHLIRATLESIAYQSRDVVEAMARDSGIRLASLRVDGGAARNNLLMQFQADILGVAVERLQVTETTALGAAYLAGLATGFWRDRAEVARLWRAERRFEPAMAERERERLYGGWQEAVARARGWEKER